MKIVRLEFLQEMKKYLKEHDAGILEDVDDLFKREKGGFEDLNFQRDLYSIKLLMYKTFFEHDKKVEHWQDSFNAKRYQFTVKCRDFDYRLARNVTRAGYWSQKDKHALFVHESGKDYIVRVDLLTNTCKTYKLSEVVPAATEEINLAITEYEKCEIPLWYARMTDSALNNIFRLDDYNVDLFWTFLEMFMKL